MDSVWQRAEQEVPRTTRGAIVEAQAYPPQSLNALFSVPDSMCDKSRRPVCLKAVVFVGHLSFVGLDPQMQNEILIHPEELWGD